MSYCPLPMAAPFRPSTSFKPPCIPVKFQPTYPGSGALLPVATAVPVATAAAAASVVPTTVTTTTVVQKKTNLTWLWWVLGALVVLLIIALFYNLWRRSLNTCTQPLIPLTPAPAPAPAPSPPAPAPSPPSPVPQPPVVNPLPLPLTDYPASAEVLDQQRAYAAANRVGAPALPNGSAARNYGSGSVVSSKTSMISDDGLFSFFGDADAPTPTPGYGMPASFTRPESEANRRWRAVPIGPMSEAGAISGADGFDPDCDDAMMLPPTVTLDQQRKALMRDAAMRPLSNGRFGSTKNIGKSEGIWNIVNPPPQRTGDFRPTGNIAFGISDSYWTAAACGAQPGLDALYAPNALGSIDQVVTSGKVSIGNAGVIPMTQPLSLAQCGGGAGVPTAYSQQQRAMEADLVSTTGRRVSAMGASEW